MATLPMGSHRLARASRTRRLLLGLLTLCVALLVLATSGAWILNSGFAGAAQPRTRQAIPQIATRPQSIAAPARGPISADLRKAEAAVQASPSDPEAHAQLGFAYLQAARETGDPTDYGRAEAALNDAVRLDPRNVDGIIGQGSLALSRHQFTSALSLGRRALTLNPSIARTYGVIADAQIELGQYDAALLTVQKMVNVRPDLASYSRVSYLRELHGDLLGAIAAMELAVSAAGPASENTEYVRVQLGNLYFTTGRIDLARATYERSLAVLPNYHFALAGLARVEAAQGDYAAAIALYERATARLPLPEIVIGLGETLEAAGRAQEAQDQYALVQAMQQLFAANGVRTDMEMASFFADHGDATQAVTLAEAAFKERPSVFAADTLAWALYRAGRASEAAPYLAAALRLGTQNSRLLYHAGMIEIALGRTDAARAHLREALSLNPHFAVLDAPRAADALRGLTR